MLFITWLWTFRWLRILYRNIKFDVPDKALYYFSRLNITYDNIWFLEDDVFFYNEQVIINIDSQYTNNEILTNNYYENNDGHTNNWHWKTIHNITPINLDPPYYCCMICAVRLSKQILLFFDEYAINNKTIFFIEAFFPTIAIKNNLTYNIPIELSCITFNKIFDINIINKSYIYHPLKDLNQHVLIRKLLDNQLH